MGRPCPCTATTPCLKAWACWFWLKELPLDGTEERRHARRAVARTYTRHLEVGRPWMTARTSVLWPLWPAPEGADNGDARL